ncbi:hypothetical protein GCM10011351_20720 [Paraliobacillus quinghaiensis]|uniref:Aspartyl-phosphate phosphatase Spo0E family protein n=1 Tax=Paraliobacillus quinghaiensis TaxID=470815 RepID=A0A917WUW4_9BACI|nr:aspartyl-phosphate phosphatase Spo0E family protein [Paraliobacillus quinghaiensis]GGM34573.1 hypothetical protein GCM10011351_20720 [Paraliobacillus quinghaiensis]
MTIKIIKFKIKILRTIMIHKAKTKGITHPETVKSSQLLDSVLNRYQRIKQKSRYNYQQ